MTSCNNYSKDGITVSTIQDVRRPLKNGLYPIKIRVTYQRRHSYYPTGKSLSANDWERLYSSRLQSLCSLRRDIENSFELVRAAVEKLASQGDFTLSKLNVSLKHASISTVNDAICQKVAYLRECGQIGTAQVYVTLLRTIERFAGGKITFEDITPEWLRRYENFLCSEGKKQTTIAISLRTLRAVFNEARKNTIIRESLYPFGRGKFEIHEGEGRKLALAIEDIKKIACYTTELSARRKYRDYWLFLYLCNGLNVADFVQLRYSDIVDGEIRFFRKKTQRTARIQHDIRVVVSDEMRNIIEKHGNADRKGYIFPVLNGTEDAEGVKLKTQYLTRAINKHMKQIALELGIPHVSTYTARHSFATVLKRAGVNIAYISESLGHSNIKTTEHYLASFEREEREKNAKLLMKF